MKWEKDASFVANQGDWEDQFALMTSTYFIVQYFDSKSDASIFGDLTKVIAVNWTNHK